MAQTKAKKKLGGPKVGGDGPRQAKVDAVDQVKTRLAESSAVVLTEYRGMTVQELAELRTGLREAGGEYKVYKNTLAKIAADGLGLEGLDPLFEGPTAFAFATGDPVELAKKLSEFAKKVPALVLKGGLLDGKVLTAAQVGDLANLDSREVMLAKAAGMFLAKIQQAANLFSAGFNNMGSLLAQLRDKLPADGTAEPVAEEAPAEPVAEAAPEPAAEAAPEPAAEAAPEPTAEAAPAEPGEPAETTES